MEDRNDFANTNINTNTKEDEDDDDNFICGVYLAKSTLIGTGIGMYAGSKGYEPGEDDDDDDDDDADSEGTAIVPDTQNYFLWDQYTWNAAAFGIGLDNLGLYEISLASPGFGASANSFMDFVNVDEGNVNPNGIGSVHRYKDSGSGGFTPYHSRKAQANTKIQPYSELFVSYGSKWFIERQHRLGTIPVKGDHTLAELLYHKFYMKFLGGKQKLQKQKRTQKWKGIRTKNGSSTKRKQLIIEFNHKHSSESESDLYIKIKQSKMKRSPDWLKKHGVCADSIRIGISTIENKQAGHGAFTNTQFKEGDVIMSVPLIHIPNRTILDTYYIYDHEKYEKNNNDKNDDEKNNGNDENNEKNNDFELKIGNEPTGHQLLLNYVLGHRDSTMVLSPYGPGFQLLNHNQTLVNCKLQWASMDRSNHHPYLLTQNVDYIKTNHSTGSVLAFEVIATKSISKNEELFLNYGHEWEMAWNTHHTKNWVPVTGSDSYVSALELNTLSINEPLQEWKENEEEIDEDSNYKSKSSNSSPYPNNVRLMLNLAWADTEFRLEYGDDRIDHYIIPKTKPKIMNGKLIDQTLYTVVIAADEGDDDEDKRIIKNVPRRGLQFEDIAYTNDQFLSNAFRHDIRIPDDLFPDAWKNNKNENNKPIIITQEQQRQRSYSQLLQQQQQQQQQQHETIDEEEEEEEDHHHHDVVEDDDDEDNDDENGDDEDDDDELPSASDL
ncbi:hypothetical protein FRACYDRAFT_196864 [Fragilariopsis cylindrus CCMP1102]|uniref:SET domain-containing protein n=1 Tax=Fragilariopsis cylindrus CCMP1102 TaxID=635003 RepID=A0A1E7EQG2_9STRA|nr:hypothetical protein FRACYDRAFT_196864 [Fragilariopsis cylindrus CCMP1102]|eukprot:OEU08037.1 hypothetical protein FRACYDRAFT_196864 [Fragilariopsis cylindrus CCMP1102]